MTSAKVSWFGTPGGQFWHARSAESNYPVCHRGIVLDLSNPMPIDEADLCVVRAGHKRTCSKCVARLERMERATQNARLTASQTWEKLEPAQREAMLGWVLGSYAPSVHAAQFPLLKSETMTRAVNMISEHWRGVLK